MNSILILGATSDMAQATAHLYARHGFEIVLAGRRTEILEQLQHDIKVRYQVPCRTYTFEATDYDSHEAFCQQFDSNLPDITALFFGYLGDQQRAETDWNESRKIIEVNYTGAVSVLNRIACRYARQGRGTMVGVSSVAGERGRQSNYLYGSAKAGFTAYLSGLRNRLYSQGVHVLTVKPGFVDTQMTAHLTLPAPLTASPQQVAKAIHSGVAKGRDVVYVLPVWRLIMQNIRLIPEAVFKRMKL